VSIVNKNSNQHATPALINEHTDHITIEVKSLIQQMGEFPNSHSSCKIIFYLLLKTEKKMYYMSHYDEFIVIRDECLNHIQGTTDFEQTQNVNTQQHLDSKIYSDTRNNHQIHHKNVHDNNHNNTYDNGNHYNCHNHNQKDTANFRTKQYAINTHDDNIHNYSHNNNNMHIDSVNVHTKPGTMNIHNNKNNQDIQDYHIKHLQSPPSVPKPSVANLSGNIQHRKLNEM
jgi:hypothetical protein